MITKREVKESLLSGLSVSGIAKRTGISVRTVTRHLRTLVGEGTLSFSEIYFSLEPAQRESLGDAIKKSKDRGPANIRKHLKVIGMTRHEFDFYRSIRQRRILAGDLYDHVTEAELSIHDMIFKQLRMHFGDSTNGYWRKGIPLKVRQKCQERCEADDDPREPFQYTDLIDLLDIIKNNWQVFGPVLPKPYDGKGKVFTKDLTRLNRIRNTVMHPVQRRLWTDDDFAFARRVHNAFLPFRSH